MTPILYRLAAALVAVNAASALAAAAPLVAGIDRQQLDPSVRPRVIMW